MSERIRYWWEDSSLFFEKPADEDKEDPWYYFLEDDDPNVWVDPAPYLAYDPRFRRFEDATDVTQPEGPRGEPGAFLTGPRA